MRWLGLVGLLAFASSARADMYPDASNAKLPEARVNLAVAPHVASNAALATAATTLYSSGLWRDDFSAGLGAPPLWYTPSGSACSLNAGNGDNGSQVKSAEGKCWLAAFPSSGIDPRQFGAVNNGTTPDDTPLAASVAYAASSSIPLACRGSYGVTGPLVWVGTGTNQLEIRGNCSFVGLASSAKSAVIEIGRSVNISGQVRVICNFNANYTSGLWVGYDGSQTQFDFFDNVATSGCLIGWRVGNAAFPGAIVSEITIKEGFTYGSPTAVRVEGANTYLNIVGSDLVSDLAVVNTAGGWFSATSSTSVVLGTGSKSFTVATGLTIPAGVPIEARVLTAGDGAAYLLGTVTSYNSGTGALVINAAAASAGTGTFTNWTIAPPTAGIQAIGAYVNQTGGHLEMPVYPGRLVNLQPLEFTPGSGQASYGRVYLANVASEFPNVYVDTLNPVGLTIAGPVTGAFAALNPYGSVSNNIAPFIFTDPTFSGSINIQNAGFWASSLRTQPNVFAGSSKTKVTVDANGFGVNFPINSGGLGGAGAVVPAVAALGNAPPNSGTCAITNPFGGNTAGGFVFSGPCNGTIILTFATAMSQGYICLAVDSTSAAATIRQTFSAPSSCTLTVTGGVNGDYVLFNAQGF